MFDTDRSLRYMPTGSRVRPKSGAKTLSEISPVIDYRISSDLD